MSHSDDTPTAADFCRACGEERGQSVRQPDPNCSACQGYGFTSADPESADCDCTIAEPWVDGVCPACRCVRCEGVTPPEDRASRPGWPTVCVSCYMDEADRRDLAG